MKTIVKIAFHELKLLFCSPIAWLLLIVFLYQFGEAFASSLAGAGPEVLKQYPGYTSWLYSSVIFPKVNATIYLYIPLMTMGVMSQELSSGNIKLLFSAPVSMRNIVLGKYFGMMLYWFILICLFMLFAIPSYLMIENLDLGIVLPGVLAIFLLACTYSAIGLFMSCLTHYQVVAALSTLTVLAALNYLDGLWQSVPVLKDVINFLNMSGHANNMNWGFIKSKDILYFLFISVLFLGLAVLYMEDMIKARARVLKMRRYVVFSAVMLALGCVFSLRNMTLYFDTTAIKFNTISPSSQALLKKIKGPVTVTAYSNLMDSKNESEVGLPKNRTRDFNFWEPYIRYLPQLELNYVNYYASDDEYYTSPEKLDTAARRAAEGRGLYIEDYLKPKEIDAVLDIKKEGYTFRRRVEQGKKQRYIRVFDDILHKPSEQEIITAFSDLLIDFQKIAFLSGHYERSIDYSEDKSYKMIMNDGPVRGSLINQGFDSKSIDSLADLPKKIDALVIADPLAPYSEADLDKIKKYIDDGGNLLITGGVNCQKILNPLAQMVGVRFKEGQLVEKNPLFTSDVVFTRTPLREGGDPYPFQFQFPMAMPSAVALEYKETNGFKIDEAAVTDEKTTWHTTSELSVDTAEIRYNPNLGDDHKQFPVALTLTRRVNGKEQRIVVVGNGDFMANTNLLRDYNSLPLAHANFGIAIFKWFSQDKYPIEVAPLPRPKDDVLNFSNETMEKFRPFYIWMLPSLVLISGSVYLLRRRRN